MVEGILGHAHISPIDALETARVQKIEGGNLPSDIRQAAQEYESFFLSYLMKAMRATVPKGELTANPMGETFYSLYDEEIGKRSAQSGGFGLADAILASLAHNSPSPPRNLSEITSRPQGT